MIDVLYVLLTMLPLLAIAGGIVVAGYFAYQARVERETVANMPPWVDPVHEMPALREELQKRMAENRALLERTRAAVERGTKG